MNLALDLDVQARLAPASDRCPLPLNADEAVRALERLDPEAHVGPLADRVGRLEGLFGIEYVGAIGARGSCALDEDDPDAE